jgi:hypothetical protein
VAGAEARQARDLLIFLDDDIHFASDFVGRNFDRDFAFQAVLLRVVIDVALGADCFSGTHVFPFRLPGPLPYAAVSEGPFAQEQAQDRARN